MLGRRFHRALAGRRTAQVAFPENLTSNSHVHALVRMVPDRHGHLENLLEGDKSLLWTKVMPKGPRRFASLSGQGQADYSVKDLSPETEVLLFTQPHPVTAREIAVYDDAAGGVDPTHRQHLLDQHWPTCAVFA